MSSTSFFPLFNELPKINDDSRELTNVLKIPWNSLYLEYFWVAISQGRKITLFENKVYNLSEADVAVIILMSRYQAKARSIFSFDPDTRNRLRDFGHAITLFLHDQTQAIKEPIEDIFKILNIHSSYDRTLIYKFFLSNNNEFRFIDKNIYELIENISPFMRALNFNIFLRAIIVRRHLEKSKNHFQSIKMYYYFYHYFSKYEHIADFIFDKLFAFQDQEQFLNKIAEVNAKLKFQK